MPSPSLLSKRIARVCGVISLYGQSDLSATYFHTCQHLISRSALATQKRATRGGRPSWLEKKIGNDFHRLGFDKNVQPGMLVPMLGGNPDEKRELYSLYSPITYVHSDCPPTLFVHGAHDCLAPLKAIQILERKLKELSVPVVIDVIPQTDHAFDLILPKISPSACNGIYDIERFLAILAEYRSPKKVPLSKSDQTQQ